MTGAARFAKPFSPFSNAADRTSKLARQLNIHRNTLAYRLKQIADYTRRDPADPSARLTLHLALLGSMLPPAP